MAKVFYFMLTSRIGPDQMDWSQSAGFEVAAGEPIMFDGDEFRLEAFHRGKSSGDSLSSAATLSVATRPEWALDGVDGGEVPQGYLVQCQDLRMIDIMVRLQILVGRLGMQWFHPDDATIIARNEGSGLYIAIQASGGAEVTQVSLVVQFFRGEADEFHAFCRAVEDAMAGNLKDSSI
jgi:hypothetical protein